MVKIITDSTCNLDNELLARHDVRVAPIAIQFGEQTFEEGIDIDRNAFYSRIERTGRIPTTSQPSPSWFERFYRQVHAQGDQALVITVTAKHSGTYQSALLAKAMVPQASVEVFDSASISLGTGWMVVEAARASERGQPLASILERLDHIRRHLHLVITPATLKYLQMSGRVGKLQERWLRCSTSNRSSPYVTGCWKQASGFAREQGAASPGRLYPGAHPFSHRRQSGSDPCPRAGGWPASARPRPTGAASAGGPDRRSGGLVGRAWRAGGRWLGSVSGLRPAGRRRSRQSPDRRTIPREWRQRGLIHLGGTKPNSCGSGYVEWQLR